MRLFGVRNAVRCNATCSALRWLVQRAAMTDAAHCVPRGSIPAQWSKGCTAVPLPHSSSLISRLRLHPKGGSLSETAPSKICPKTIPQQNQPHQRFGEKLLKMPSSPILTFCQSPSTNERAYSPFPRSPFRAAGQTGGIRISCPSPGGRGTPGRAPCAASAPWATRGTGRPRALGWPHHAPTAPGYHPWPGWPGADAGRRHSTAYPPGRLVLAT